MQIDRKPAFIQKKAGFYILLPEKSDTNRGGAEDAEKTYGEKY